MFPILYPSIPLKMPGKCGFGVFPLEVTTARDFEVLNILAMEPPAYLPGSSLQQRSSHSCHEAVCLPLFRAHWPPIRD